MFLQFLDTVLKVYYIQLFYSFTVLCSFTVVCLALTVAEQTGFLPASSINTRAVNRVWLGLGLRKIVVFQSGRTPY